MDPPYQRRGGLWNTFEQAMLLDSVINQYDIPKFYIADFALFPSSLNIGGKPYAIVDGKQRFEAIFSFFNGSLALAENTRSSYDLTIDLAGMRYVDIARNYPEIAEKVESFQLDVMSILTDDEARINDLFVRLNRSKPLTGAEIRNAMEGDVPVLIRELARHPFFAEYVKFSIRRGQDLNTAGKLLLIEFWGRLTDTKKRQLDRLAREGAIRAEAQTIDFQRAADRVSRILDVMTQMFSRRDQLLRSQGPITLYYWVVRAVGDVLPLGTLYEFFDELDNTHLETRASVRSGAPIHTLDPEMLVYDSLSRSTNDEGSLEGRFEIALRRLERRYPGVTELMNG